MGRILTKRRVAFIAAVGAAAALLAQTAGGAVHIGGLPGSPAAAPASTSATAGDAWEAHPAQSAAGEAGVVLAATASCVTAGSSRTVMTHSLDSAHHVWVVHVARPLCSALFVQDASYRMPLQGGRAFPQTLQGTAKLVRMQRPGTYRVPLVARTTCVQTDTGASWGSAPRWPHTLAKLGVTQPQQLSHWSRGPNTWFILPAAQCKPFLPAPKPVVTTHCPQDCTGIADVTVSAHNPVTFSALQIAPFINGRMLTNHLLRIGPGGSGSVTFKARDGDTITLAYVFPNSTHPPYKRVGNPVKVQCPPGAPPVVVTFSCPCQGDVTGTVAATNASRFGLQVAVLVGGVQKAVLTVAAHGHGAVTLGLSRQAVLTFGFRYNVTGQFPATFTRIAFKVTTSA